MKFRHDRILPEPWAPGLPGYDALIDRTPRSITAVRKEGVQWLKQHLGE